MGLIYAHFMDMSRLGINFYDCNHQSIINQVVSPLAQRGGAWHHFMVGEPYLHVNILSLEGISDHGGDGCLSGTMEPAYGDRDFFH